MSHMIGNQGGALLLSGFSVMDIRIGTLLGGLLFRIGTMDR